MKKTTTNHALHVQSGIKKNWENIAKDRHEVIELLRQRVRWMNAAVVVAACVGYLIGKAW